MIRLLWEYFPIEMINPSWEGHEVAKRANKAGPEHGYVEEHTY